MRALLTVWLHRAGVCAIVKGVYLVQLRQQDFFYHGKDVTIWTGVETATAIIAASIPILRVFFKETVSSYSRSHGRSQIRSTKTNILSSSNVHRSQQSTSHVATVQAKGKAKDGGWVSLGNIGEDGDNLSQRSILRRDEDATSSGNAGVAVHDGDGILQVNAVTVTAANASEGRNYKDPWLR